MLSEQRDAVLVAEPKTKAKKPPFYKVVLLNDDFTPMDFVVMLLKQLFHKTHEDAIKLMLEVHNRGSAICGLYTLDVAETKTEQAVAAARVNDYPLQCLVEKE